MSTQKVSSRRWLWFLPVLAVFFPLHHAYSSDPSLNVWLWVAGAVVGLITLALSKTTQKKVDAGAVLGTIGDTVVAPRDWFWLRVLMAYLLAACVGVVAWVGSIQRSIECAEPNVVVETSNWWGDISRTNASPGVVLRTWVLPWRSIKAECVTSTFARLPATDDGRTLRCVRSEPPRPPTLLRVALSSSYAHALKVVVELVARRHPDLQVSVDIVSYPDARATFCSDAGRWDLVMLDEPWLSTHCALKSLDGLVPADLPIHATLSRRGWVGNSLVATPWFANLTGVYSREGVRAAPGPQRLGFRRDSANNIVEALFALLGESGCNPEAMASGDALLLPQRETEAAMAALMRGAKSGRDRSSASDLFQRLGGGEVDAVLGWSSWPAASFGRSMGATKFQTGTRPLSGAWFWGIPAGSSVRPNVVAGLIAELTSRDVQLQLPPGVLSVLTNVEVGEPSVRSALSRSLARPRMANWMAVEIQLGDALQAAFDRRSPLLLTGDLVRFVPERCTRQTAAAGGPAARRVSNNARRGGG